MIELAAFIAALLFVSDDDPSRRADVPARFESRWDRRPLWVARERTTAIDALRRGELTERQLANIRSRIASTAERRAATTSASDGPRCDALFAGYIAYGGEDDFPARSFTALRELAAKRSVFTGTVKAVEAGIHNGQPFSVIAVDRPGASPVYLLYPQARVEIDGALICNADPSFAGLPRAGEPIVFLAARAVDATERLYFVRADRIFYEREGAVVSAPALALDPELIQVRSLGQLLEQLRPERPRPERAVALSDQ